MYDFLVLFIELQFVFEEILVVYYFTFRAKRIYIEGKELLLKRFYIEGKELLLKFFILVLIYFP